MTTQPNKMSVHKERCFNRAYDMWGAAVMCPDIYEYDSADDGPEVKVCQFFNLFPNGSISQTMRSAYLEVE